ncbi:hypothetical protein psal_cds_769 [Pandoravirus salinus]|uniref:Uncharacterized protein n=1 Tax=Pandoravirus salinus TaxID=1349410 RepID=S4VWL8_9VIRU|nr:hypothetical protein psal_cds_769 [Pandoravirus salinus]AGO84768.1 hypothetical protein psal_cds_769 [Pandoravirus salinus]
METLDKFLARRHRRHGARFVWRHFTPCCDETLTPHPGTLASLGVGVIQERRRRLIERDYHQRPVNAYDYRWQFADDPDHVHVLDSNVRMNKCYWGRWHWYPGGIESRLYTIAAADNDRTRWPRTYAVHANECPYAADYDSETGEPDYNAWKEEDYEHFAPPYSNLRDFSVPVPRWAVEQLEVPRQCDWSDALDRRQKVALILLFKEGGHFASGK